jgi:transglutaminase-like putative cysteine protease
MRLVIDHHTRYNFSEPQARVVQLLRMTPQDFAGQTVTDWRIDVDADARLREGRDGYGNITTMLYVDGPIDGLSIMVRGEVLTDAIPGPIKGTQEPLPPMFFKRITPQTDADGAVAAIAAGIAGTTLDDAAALTLAVHKAVRAVPGRTPKGITAAEVIAKGEGSVRDCAHVMLAAARAAGFAARLVSGHCLDGPNAGSHKSAHCWTELHIEGPVGESGDSDGGGWYGFDPSTGAIPGESYARVAVGLDASDSTPLSGTRRGGGIEELDVEVRVAMSQSQG